MDEMQDSALREPTRSTDPRGKAPLPQLTHAEREFWRRAVENERRRQRCGRPAPFPFQPA
jgi:hypothetical protein